MTASPLLEFVAREHPAFVHLPLGLVAALPVAILISFFLKHAKVLTGTAFFLALVAWAGSTVALLSGLLWGRQINLIPPSGFLPVVASEKQVLQKMLQLHEFAAGAGFLVGGLCVLLLWRAWRSQDGVGPADRRHGGRRFWERGAGAPALLVSLLWLGTWGFSGKLGLLGAFPQDRCTSFR